MELSISAYSALTSKGLAKNGVLLYENKAQESFLPFSKALYRFLDLSYPKFFKMDELCRLAFLAAEPLLSEKEGASYAEEDEIAIVLGNKSSSVVSDLKHYASFEDKSNYFPSPAVFVYTLPNIMLGELCIRHQITGENSCFLMESLQGDFMYHYVHDLFEQEGYKRCLCGWVDYSTEGYSAYLFLIEKSTQITQRNSFIIKFDPNFTNLIP